MKKLILMMMLLSCEMKGDLAPVTVFPSESFGCASFIVYKVDKKEKRTIAVIGSRERLELSEAETHFDLEKADFNDLRVELKEFNKEPESYYCNDLLFEGQDVVDVWTAYKGTVSIKIEEDNIRQNPIGEPEYLMTVKISNAELSNQKGDKVSVQNVGFEHVYVGWLPG